MNTVQFVKATIGFSINLFQGITCGRLIYIEAYTQQSFSLYNNKHVKLRGDYRHDCFGVLYGHPPRELYGSYTESISKGLPITNK